MTNAAQGPRSFRWTSALGVVLTAGMLLVACGGLSDSGAPDTTPATTTTTAALATRAVATPTRATAPSATSLPVATTAAPAATTAGAPGDSLVPIPIDNPPPGGPSTYKGLPLALTDNGQPVVMPVDGIIGVVCIGMSNANLECQDFIDKVDAGRFADAINPAVRFVNCAVGGNAIERWDDPTYDDGLWDICLRKKIVQRGLRPDQIRVVWHKAARQFTGQPNGEPLPSYPDPASDYFLMLGALDQFAQRVKEKIPSVQAVYVTSRSYAGFALDPLRGDPLSYEEGHALNQWLAANPVVNGIWFGWGPYIYAPPCASGQTNGSSICYEKTDYLRDGVHPAQGARDKISMLLHQRFSQEAWYRP